jgi:ABC-type transporter Mla MlaB component
LAGSEGWRASLVPSPRPPPDPDILVMIISGPIAQSDVPILCEQVRTLLEGTDAGLVVCDLAALGGPDAATIDALARLQLTARRLGSGIRLRHACDELRDLLVLTGLDEVVRLDPRLPPEVSGQPEEREPAPSVEEEGDPGDPPV